MSTESQEIDVERRLMEQGDLTPEEWIKRNAAHYREAVAMIHAAGKELTTDIVARVMFRDGWSQRKEIENDGK